MSAGERGTPLSVERKMEAVLRLLRGEDPDALSRELGVPAAEISEWRDAVLTGGRAGLRRRPGDGRDEEVRALKAKAADLTMRLELSEEAARRMRERSRPPRRGGKRG